jgi:hypothetical protein
MGNPSLTTAYLLAFGLVALVIGHGLWLASRKRWHLLDPLNFFWAGMLTIFVSQVFSDGATLLAWHGAEEIERTLLAAIFLSAFAIVGYESSIGFRHGLQLPAIATRMLPQRLYVLAWIIIGLAMCGYGLLFYRVGGIDEFLAVGRGWAEPVRDLPIPAFLQTLTLQLPAALPIGCLLLVLHAEIFHRPPLTRLVAWIFMGALWLWFLYLGSRSRLVFTTLAALAAFFLPRRKSPPLVLGVAVFAALMLLTAFQQHFRHRFVNLSFNIAEETEGEMLETILPSFMLPDEVREERLISAGTELNCVITVLKLVPGEVPYNYGYGFLELITRWIPRAIWPSKFWPHTESMQGVLAKGGLSFHVDEGTGLLTGPAFTIVGYWFNAGGWIGLAIGGWLGGWLTRVLRTIMDRSTLHHAFLVLYPPLMGLPFLDVASTPFYWVYFVPFTLGPAVLAVWLCRAPVDPRQVDRVFAAQASQVARARPISRPKAAFSGGFAGPARGRRPRED